MHLQYGADVAPRLSAPEKLDDAIARIIAPIRDKAIDNIPDLLKRLALLQKNGHDVTIYPDAEEFIEQRMAQIRLRTQTDEIRRDPEQHSLRTTLLKVPLLPYQLDGVAFAAGAGRAVLADDMGLGKTIQAVGAAEFLRAPGKSAKCWSSARRRLNRSGAMKFRNSVIETCN